MKTLPLTKVLMAAAAISLTSAAPIFAHADANIGQVVSNLQEDMVQWRRDFHQHPELGNQEFRTSKIVENHLKSLGMEVRTDIAVTGVVGVLKGSKPGPTIAFRADMDALPMAEATNLPFASKETAEYGFATVPVSHACGHDAHTAILMGAAEALASMKSEISGTIIFVFQPAEEGVPIGESGGAARMLDEGVFSDDLKPEAMFALHVEPGPVGKIYTRPNGFLAGATAFKIAIEGAGTHAAKPWSGTDLPSLGADIVKATSIIAARRVNVLEDPTVLSVGKIAIGTRSNILPASGLLEGTLRTYSEERLAFVISELNRSVASLSQIYGATSTVAYSDQTPPTVNSAELLQRVAPSLDKAASLGVDTNALRRPAAEDFSFFAREIPSVYFILGSTPDFTDFKSAPSNHSPEFDIDEHVLSIGAKAFVHIALDYLNSEEGIAIRYP